MEWERIKNYTEVHKFSYELFNPLIHKKEILLTRIPYILDPTKHYPTFTIECNTSKKIILKKYNPAENLCKLFLSYNYYTAPEIFNIFNIPKIKSYNQVGHIIHLNLEPEHQSYKHIIGNIILTKTNAKTVVQKLKLNKIMRNVECELLAGDNNLTTWHNENGLKFFIDYGNVYWNSKLADERNSLKLSGVVVDPFCGCGAFVLYALRQNCKVFCNDLNPVAMDCVKINVETYKKTYRTGMREDVDCVGMNMDAGKFLEGIDFHVDHFLFNLPEYSLDYVKYLSKFEKYTLHCYFFAHDIDSAIKSCNEKCYMEITHDNLRFIRKVSPSKNMYKLTISVEDNK